MDGSIAISVIRATGDSVRGVRLIGLNLIQADPDLQMREAGIDVGVVAEYAEAMEGGEEFPPVIVYFDGEVYWPADGFHRIDAAKKIGRDTISADVRQGSKRDAVLLAVGVNANHGLRRTSADKRRSVLAMLRDPEWSRLSDREIGKRCAVDHKTVGNIRREITGGEIPHRTAAPPITGKITTADEGAEIPHGSMVDRLLAKASDEAIIGECRRRGLEVSHAD